MKDSKPTDNEKHHKVRRMRARNKSGTITYIV